MSSFDCPFCGLTHESQGTFKGLTVYACPKATPGDPWMFDSRLWSNPFANREPAMGSPAAPIGFRSARDPDPISPGRDVKHVLPPHCPPRPDGSMCSVGVISGVCVNCGQHAWINQDGCPGFKESRDETPRLSGPYKRDWNNGEEREAHLQDVRPRER
jgi:hypothetical protein